MSITYTGNGVAQQFGSSSSAVSVNLTSSTVAGRMLVVSVGIYGSANVSVSDSYSNAWTQVGSGPVVSGADGVQMFYAPLAAGKAGSGHQITVTPSANCYKSVDVREYDGDGTWALASTVSDHGSSNAPNPGSITTPSGNLIVSAASHEAPGAWSFASGYTADANLPSASNEPFATQHGFSTGATTTPSFGTSNSNNWAARAAVFGSALTTRTGSHTADGLLLGVMSHAHTVDASLRATPIRLHVADALVRGVFARTQTVDAVLAAPPITTYTLAQSTDALLRTTRTRLHTADALAYRTATRSHAMDTYLHQLIVSARTSSHAANALLHGSRIRGHGTDALVGMTGMTGGPDPGFLIVGGHPRLGIIRWPGHTNRFKFRITQEDDYRIVAFGIAGPHDPIPLLLWLDPDADPPGPVSFDERSGPYGNPALTVHLTPGNYMIRVTHRSPAGMARYVIQAVRGDDPWTEYDAVIR
jgi:hypothetical protein